MVLPPVGVPCCYSDDPVPPRRQGAQFVESWVDGFAFAELSRRQESVSQQREELEKQRKQLSKRKVTSTGQQNGTGWAVEVASS